MNTSVFNKIRQIFSSRTPKINRRCVVTGIGVVSPVGIGKEEFFENLMAGKTGVGKITRFDTSAFANKIAAEIKDFDPTKYMKKTHAKYLALGAQYACAAFKLASQDANVGYFDPYRTDVVLGGASSGLDILSENVFNEKADTKKMQIDMNQLSMLKIFINAPASAVAFMAKTKGYVTTISSACSSAMNAVGLGRDRILANQCDMVIVGGVDAPINPLVLNGYCAADFLTSNEDPKSLRPFDKNHDKAILGEGSAVFILEELNSALARNATIYGEITSFAQANENMNIIFSADKSGQSWSEVITRAITGKDGLKSIDYINAHGPSDKTIDNVELKALQLSLRENLDNISITSIKGVVGSGMASAGAFQIASSLMSLKTGQIPPSLNFEETENEYKSIHISRTAETQQKIKNVLINGHAIGGTNASLIIEEYVYD